MGQKYFVLCDCNAFYAACETLFEPRLKKVPLVVLSNNDGSVVSLNAAAKQMGLTKGQPFFLIRDLCKTAGLVPRSSNFELYGELSARVHDTLRTFGPMEPYSIDEGFLLLEAVKPEHLGQVLHTIRLTVERWTGISVSLGAGRSKTLSKAACWVAKKQMPEIGVFSLTDEPLESEVLGRMPVGEVWGIGHRWASLLQGSGVETALQLRNLPEPWVRKKLSVVGLRTVMELRGVSCLPLELAPPARKSVCTSRSFGRPVTSLGELQQAVSAFTAKACRRLRREGRTAGYISVFAHSDPHKEGYYSATAGASLNVATGFTPAVLKVATALATRVYQEGIVFKKAGVLLTQLGDADAVQLSLFSDFDPEDERPEQLMNAVDKLNDTLGPGTVRFAAEGLHQGWQTRAAFRSHRYTTRWGEIPTIG